MFNEFNIKEYQDYFDKAVSEKIFNELDELDYELVSQERHGHYSHVFKSEDPNLPDDKESYAANFFLAKDRQGSKTFNEQFKSNVIPFLKKNFPTLKFFLEPNIVQIKEGAYFRAHTDAYAGDIGYTFFFSKGWKWDYGGLLTFVNKQGAFPVFPMNNKFVLRNEKEKPQHFVSNVSNWSKSKYYYLLVGWAATTDQGDSTVRGSYYKYD